jgi:hypothetical protein
MENVLLQYCHGLYLSGQKHDTSEAGKITIVPMEHLVAALINIGLKFFRDDFQTHEWVYVSFISVSSGKIKRQLETHSEKFLALPLMVGDALSVWCALPKFAAPQSFAQTRFSPL